MYQILHMFVLGYCGWECLVALRNTQGKFAKIIMFGGFGLIHGLIPLLTPRLMMWPRASDTTIIISAAMALLGVIMLSVGWRLYDHTKPQWPGLSPGLGAFLESAYGQRVLIRMFWLCMIIGTVGWLGSLIAKAGSLGAAFSSGRFEFRGQGNVYLSVILSHFSFLMLVPGIVCFFLPRSYRAVGIAYSAVLAVVYFYGTQGGRTMAIAILGALVMGYTLRERVTPVRFLVIGCSAVALIAVSVATYEIRKVMMKHTFGEAAEMIVDRESYKNMVTRDPLNYHQFLVAAVEHFPSDHPFINGATYRRLAVFYLPRRHFSWIKPEDTHITFARAISASGQGQRKEFTTMPPSMMGDGWINFWGPTGVAGVTFFNGLLFGFAVQKMREHVLWFLAIGAGFVRYALMSIRGSPYEILTVLLSSTMILALLLLVSGFQFSKAKLWIRAANRMALLDKPRATMTTR